MDFEASFHPDDALGNYRELNRVTMEPLAQALGRDFPSMVSVPPLLWAWLMSGHLDASEIWPDPDDRPLEPKNDSVLGWYKRNQRLMRKDFDLRPDPKLEDRLAITGPDWESSGSIRWGK
jgi:hypothetical protein